MNGSDLLRAMGQVDERYIQEAEEAVPARPKYLWIRWAAAAAACLALVLAVGRLLAPEDMGPVSMESDAQSMGIPEGMPRETTAEVCPPGTGPAVDIFDAIPGDPELSVETDALTSDQEPSKLPGAVVRITLWREDGFDAAVEKIMCDDRFSVGAVLSFRLCENTVFVEGDGTTNYVRAEKPDCEEFPVGSVVQVQFRIQEDGTLVADMLWKEGAF